MRENLADSLVEIEPEHDPHFLYENLKFDPEDIEKGLFRNNLLILVKKSDIHFLCLSLNTLYYRQHMLYYLAPVK